MAEPIVTRMSVMVGATVIIEPRGEGGVYLRFEGRTFELRGGIVGGLREIERELREKKKIEADRLSTQEGGDRG